MRSLRDLILILTITSSAPFARADFQWLDWQVTSSTGDSHATFTPANNIPSSSSVLGVSASASYTPGSASTIHSSIQFSAQFQITNAATSLPISFSYIDLYAIVDYLPRTHGYASESLTISGVRTYTLTANPTPYGYGQGFETFDSIHDVPLADGIYTITMTDDVGFDLGPGANFAGHVIAEIRVEITSPVPEPASFALLTLGTLVAGLSYLVRRPQISPQCTSESAGGEISG